MSASEEQISQICTSCGMCCDGTLFRKANIKNAEDAALATSIGLTTTTAEQRLAFLLPCHHFHQKCSIYGEPRPHVCGAYFCRPIRRLKQDKTTLDEVRSTIDRAMILKQKFEKECLKYPEFANRPITEIRPHLNLGKLPPEQHAPLRAKYPQLFLIGFKLFPLLAEIITTQHGRNQTETITPATNDTNEHE